MNSIWHDATLSIADCLNISSVLTYQQFPPQHKNNPNGMGVSADDELHKDHLILLFSAYWHEKQDSERIVNVVKDSIDKMEAVAVAEKAFHPFKYMNYAASWQQPATTYGQAAKEEAKKVSAKYDPQGIFWKQVVGFKYE